MKLYDIYDPNIIIHNAKVMTIDMDNTIEEAIAISNNKILAVGNSKEILGLAKANTIIIDADGKTVMPGINDSHNHMWECGMLMEGLVTFGIGSIDELTEKVAQKLKSLKPGEWLQGGGWIESQFKEKRMPNKYDLDKVAKENPVVLERIFSTCACNSLALEIAGITKDTPDPVGGEIGRNKETGEPNGLLFRTAKQLVRDVMPSAFGIGKFETNQQQLERVITNAMSDYLKYGITSIVEPGLNPSTIKAYQNLYKNNKLKIRANLMPNWHGFAINEDSDFSDRIVGEYGLYTGFGNEWLSIGGLKMAIDGGLTSRTALKSWKYIGEDTIKEVPLRMDTSKLKEWVKEAHDAGWSVGIHVMGDVAIQLAVDAIYEAYKGNPIIRRHQIIHSYYPTADSLAKMKEAGMVAALQPAFIYNEADGYDALLPKDKQESFLPLRKYLNAGVIVASSTDMPSAHHNPFWGIYSAVTRKGIQGYQLGTRETITVEEMLRTMTINGAYMTEESNIKGSLEVGKLADVIMLDRNIMITEDEELKNIQVEITIIDGKIVYQK